MTVDSHTQEDRLYPITEAMERLALSRTEIYRQIRAGRLRSVTRGRKRLISASAIADHIALLEREAREDGGAA